MNNTIAKTNRAFCHCWSCCWFRKHSHPTWRYNGGTGWLSLVTHVAGSGWMQKVLWARPISYLKGATKSWQEYYKTAENLIHAKCYYTYNYILGPAKECITVRPPFWSYHHLSLIMSWLSQLFLEQLWLSIPGSRLSPFSSQLLWVSCKIWETMPIPSSNVCSVLLNTIRWTIFMDS